jgi:hypothetical protein
MNNILSVQPGEYVKGAVIADVSNAKAIQTKTGKTIFKATLRDGQHLVEATSFSKTFEHIDGKRVQFSGPGIRRGDDYNGKVGVTFGEKVVFKAVEGSTPSQTAPVAEEPRKTQGNAVSGPSRIEGVTVGMAINKAVDILIDGPDPIGAEELWQTASMIIRVAQKLQEGYLAPVTATNEVPSEEVPF